MKVGDYVRTDNGYIGKIIEIEYITPANAENRYIYRLDMDTLQWFEESNFIKSSPNIIDLIEVGDYVNEFKVIDILENDIYVSDYYAESCIGVVKVKDIKSIVTKEQFEEMEYKL